MSKITDFDKNFITVSKVTETMDIYDAEQAPFKIYGVFKEGDRFTRVPGEVSARVSAGVQGLALNTAGGRVRFKTASRKIAIYAKMPSLCRMGHMAFTGSIGFDLYRERDGVSQYVKTFVPPVDSKDGFDSILDTGSSEEYTYTVNFPLFSRVSKLYIGVVPGALISSPDEYKIETPIVYYGSSITHGGCASKPSDSYEDIISRRFSANYINLGFSGNARGEYTIAKYISSLDMSIFVYDYDHNAPSAKHLEDTHERMFKVIREKNPTLPIIIVSRAKYYLSKDEELRLEIIKTTYLNALSLGDENVYFISGRDMMAPIRDDGLVDGCHPTSLGFYFMAKGIGDVIGEILNKQ